MKPWKNSARAVERAVWSKERREKTSKAGDRKTCEREEENDTEEEEVCFFLELACLVKKRSMQTTAMRKGGREPTTLQNSLSLSARKEERRRKREIDSLEREEKSSCYLSVCLKTNERVNGMRV